jgi:trigger factor
MKIEEIKSEQFSREYKVTVPFETINAKVEERVLEAAKTFKMPGFREGKVPLSIVRQKVGKEETGRQIQNHISASVQELIESKNITPSSRPEVEILSFDEENGLSVRIVLEILPEMPAIKWEDIEVERIQIKISDKEIEEAKNNLLKEFREYKDAPEGYASKNGDKINFDFRGQIDGKDFDGNSGEKMELAIGEKYFLEDFEKNLVGCKVGEEKSFDIVFPKDYPQEDLALKTATFTITVNNVMEFEPIKEVNSSILKKIGVESEEKLNQLIKQKLTLDSVGMIRARMKKELFDKIDSEYTFDLPAKMVEQDFDIIWKEIEKNKETDENLKNKTDEQLKSEYQKISKRRVKLGLILADLSRKEKISSTDEELYQIIEMQANQNPQLKSKILEFYRNPENLEKIRGPIMEEKALDFILSKVRTKEREITSEEFIALVEQEAKENN